MAYVAFLIVLWLGIFAMLIAAGVVLLAVFGGGAALCVACRCVTGLKRRSADGIEAQKELRPGDNDAA